MRSITDVLAGFFNPIAGYISPTLILPFIVLVFLVFFYLYYIRVTRPLEGTTEWISRAIKKPRFTFFSIRHPMGKRDIAPLSIITAVFTFLALFVLGDRAAPQTFHRFSALNQSIIIELYEHEEISDIMYYTGLWTGYYTLQFSVDGKTWIEQMSVEEQPGVESPIHALDQPHSHLFKWQYADINYDNPPIKFIRIEAVRTPIELGEIAIFDANSIIIPTNRLNCPDAPELFDEQELVPDSPEYMNGMYFDEIYHGRTAYEHLRNIRPYETTHPPLGKELIAASVYVFGMTPFGYRFIGAVFGVLMLVVMYILLKNMFGKTAIAVCGTLLLGVDFMRFVQTRIATIDTYGVFFILLSFYFMYRYITTDVDAPFKKCVLPLALSGVAFGLGCASKWIVPYAGIGLAIIYCIRQVMLGKHYKDTNKEGFKGYLGKTLAFSVLFFVVVPVVIYCLSYIPYGLSRSMTIRGGMLWDPLYYEIIWDNQVSMFRYHGTLEATHPYSSWWYQWIIDGRPILYYNSYRGDLRSSFAAFGNPIVWWGGFFAMIAMVVHSIKHRDSKALVILIGYLSQLLPWVAVTRIVFIYHYFPSTLFLIMAIAYVFNIMLERGNDWAEFAIYGYVATACSLFVLFYPALTGVYVNNWYFRHVLRWFPGAWPF